MIDKSDQAIGKILVWLLILSTLIRGFLAAYLEFGNDEVYYWTYALYPDYSHFDHPPMVGWVIQVFSLNLLLEHEFFIRLSAVVLGTVNTWMIFIIGARLKNKLTGLYAAILFTASIYCFVIAGTFILPDTPQVFFWLLSILFLTNVFFSNHKQSKKNIYLILAGITIGLGMLSKYTTIFLWAGTMIYILFYDRQWLKRSDLYISILSSVILFLPVINWNILNDWISFTYQGERANLFASGININSFLREMAGQILYNNPVNVALIILALFAITMKKRILSSNRNKFLLLTSVPLILTFLFVSLFRGTLPHWSSPGYLGLIILAAAFLTERKSKFILPLRLQVSVVLLLLVLVLGTGQIKGGWLLYDGSDDPRTLGRKDVSLDMYGWRQLGKKYKSNGLPIVSHRWFPAANLDYYVAKPNGLKVLAIGDLSSIHKYAWINKERGGFQEGMDVMYLTMSRDYKDPYDHYRNYFEEISPVDTIRITRSGKHVQNVFIYQMNNLLRIPQN